MRYDIGGGRQVWGCWGSVAAGVVLMNILGDVVCGTHGGAVPASVSTGNGPHQHRGGKEQRWF